MSFLRGQLPNPGRHQTEFPSTSVRNLDPASSSFKRLHDIHASRKYWETRYLTDTFLSKRSCSLKGSISKKDRNYTLLPSNVSVESNCKSKFFDIDYVSKLFFSSFSFFSSKNIIITQHCPFAGRWSFLSARTPPLSSANANTRALSTSRARAEKGIGITADLGSGWFLGERPVERLGNISVRVYHEQYEIKRVELVRNKFVPTRRDIS